MANPAIRCDLPDAAFRAAEHLVQPSDDASAESATRYELTLWYPDTNQITAQARTGSQTGERLWLIHDVG